MRETTDDVPADGWRDLPAQQLMEHAVQAARRHDADALVSLTDAYLTLFPGKDRAVSAHTRRAYATSIHILLASWRKQDLLNPEPGAGSTWIADQASAGAWRKDGTVSPASAATMRVRLAAVRALYRALRWAAATTADPFAGVRSAAETVASWDKRRPYTQLELVSLLAAAGGVDTVILLLGSDAGLRVAEIRALRWEDCDLEGRSALVRREGIPHRRIALSPRVAAALGALERRDDCVVPLTDSALRKRMRALCARAGVPYLGVHALRHAAGTSVVRDGGTIEEAAQRLGHASPVTARAYREWSRPAVQRDDS